jgi:hypothetical protein
MPRRPEYPVRQSWLERFDRRCLDPRFVRALEEDALETLVAEVHPGVFEFPLLSREYAEALLREIHAFEHWCERQKAPPTRPNTMNRQGVVLVEMGLEDSLYDLLDRWLLPMTRRWFAAHAGEHLDHLHAFVVEYAQRGDTSLDFHVDDSEVTLNACLGHDFEGAEVYFCGERCESHRAEAANDSEAWAWAPEVGRAILHAGAHRHGVRRLRAGRRTNLIVWARSSRYRIAHARPHLAPQPWCPACEAA